MGGNGTLFNWQAVEMEEFDFAVYHWGTEGLIEFEFGSIATLKTNGCWYPWVTRLGN